MVNSWSLTAYVEEAIITALVIKLIESFIKGFCSYDKETVDKESPYLTPLGKLKKSSVVPFVMTK